MCELMGMSANVPTDACFSFSGLMHRGGESGPHKDGWGITFYEGKGYRAFKDVNPSSSSRLAHWIKDYPIKSCTVISHIRQANVGAVNLENTHPFTRELWGRYWTFAHNGQLAEHLSLEVNQQLPVGETDSERAFCWLLESIKNWFSSEPADKTALFELIAQKCRELQPKGVFNMLLTDGEYLMAFCSNHLCWITRKAPFGKATLSDIEMSIDFHEETTPNDIVTVLATHPLTEDEPWEKMNPGDFVVFAQGEKQYFDTLNING